MNRAPKTRILLVVTIGSGILGAGSGKPGNACNPEDLMFTGSKKRYQVTSGPVQSAGHSNNWVGIYVDELARDTYLSAGSQYPVCAKVVKPIYEDAAGESVRKLTMMVKLAPGYDPENGDWWYASSNAAGTVLSTRGKRRDCIVCHKQAAETDFLFSADVLESAKE